MQDGIRNFIGDGCKSRINKFVTENTLLLNRGYEMENQYLDGTGKRMIGWLFDAKE